MNKRGQLLQIFEIIGTIIVIFLLCFLAQAYGTGENFFKQHIAQDLALTADALYINPGEKVSADCIVEADKFEYRIVFTGNNENDNFVWVKGGRFIDKTGGFIHFENLFMDQSHPFVSKNSQPFTAGITIDSPKMLSLEHSDKLEVAKKE